MSESTDTGGGGGAAPAAAIPPAAPAAVAVGAAEAFCVGARVADVKNLACCGAVRYIGPVATSKKKDAVWIGVAWDSAERGKHDGAVTPAGGQRSELATCAAADSNLATCIA